MDPLAEKYYFLSPYAFCSNNPVNFVDLDGEDIWQINGQGYISWVKESEEHRLYTTDENVDDIFNIFKFAADNTSVEWVVHKNGDAYTLGTIHDSDRAGNWEDYGLEKPDASVHSHPGIPATKNDEEVSMGIYREGPNKARAIIGNDWYNVRQDIDKNGKTARKSYVYFPISKNYYVITYNGPRLIKR